MGRRNRLTTVVVVIIVAVIAAAVAGIWAFNRKPSAAVQTGISYVKEAESQDTETLENSIKAQWEEEARKKRAEQLESLANGETDVWSLFQDYAMIGDSRMTGFSYYGFMPENRVLARKSLTIANIMDYESQLKELNPTLIFLSFGANDVLQTAWDTADKYADAYEKILLQLREAFPNSTICVNSILETSRTAYEKTPKLEEIPEYNEALEKMCAEDGFIYIDNTEVVADHTDLYESDGIHFSKQFYPYWAANMIVTVSGAETQNTSDESVSSGSSASSSDSGTEEGTK